MNLTDILTQPIPDMSSLRTDKKGYRQHALLLSDSPRNAEPLIMIENYGIAGQSYYSRPNKVTGQPLEQVNAQVYVRQGIAERLAEINRTLQASAEVAELLGGRVELYVDEGFRSANLQQQLYEQLIPALIRKQNPDWSDEQVFAQRDKVIAEPAQTAGSPSPHLTGSAVDLKLRYMQPNLGFVPKVTVPMGHRKEVVHEAGWPDGLEHTQALTEEQANAQLNRRVFYWVMRGALLGDDSGFVVNPGEWWHWSFGDQLWAQLTNAPQAFYGEATLPR